MRFLKAHIRFDSGKFDEGIQFGFSVVPSGYSLDFHLGMWWVRLYLDWPVGKYEYIQVIDYTDRLKVLEPEESPLMELLRRTKRTK